LPWACLFTAITEIRKQSAPGAVATKFLTVTIGGDAPDRANLGPPAKVKKN